MRKVLLAHGSSDARHGEQVRSLAERVSSTLDKEIGAAFLSDKTLPADAEVMPLFLGAGKHTTEDIPKLVAASGCRLLPSLNDHSEAIAELAYDQLTRESKRINVLFALYRFSGFKALTGSIHTMNKRCSKVAMASIHSEPSVTSVLQLWHEDGLKEVTIQPMLLFGGHSLDRVQAMIDASPMTETSLAPVLSEYDGFAELVADCLREKDEA